MKSPLVGALLASTLVAVAATVACDSSDDNIGLSMLGGGEVCPSFTPCGGDLVGTWHTTSVCEATGMKSCPGIVTTYDRGAGFDQSYVFAKDGSTTFMETASTQKRLSYPIGCLGSSGSYLDGDKICESLERSLDRPIPPSVDAGNALDGGTEIDAQTTPVQFSTARCGLSASTMCACTLNQTSAPYSEWGTYTTSGSKLTAIILGSSVGSSVGSSDANQSVDAGSAWTSTFEFCVSGNTLTLAARDPSALGAKFLVLTR